jgi:hypothetical protein
VENRGVPGRQWTAIAGERGEDGGHNLWAWPGGVPARRDVRASDVEGPGNQADAPRGGDEGFDGREPASDGAGGFPVRPELRAETLREGVRVAGVRLSVASAPQQPIHHLGG